MEFTLVNAFKIATQAFLEDNLYNLFLAWDWA